MTRLHDWPFVVFALVWSAWNWKVFPHFFDVRDAEVSIAAIEAETAKPGTHLVPVCIALLVLLSPTLWILLQLAWLRCRPSLYRSDK